MALDNMLENWAHYRHSHPTEDNDQPDWAAYATTIKWAMAVDLDACSGCNACVVACYAENNLPVVGKDKFSHGQVMHWMRIERYWDESMGVGDYDVSKGAQFLPMMCQQCEAAPCETVCPVGATNHTPDGLNSQIYNRCIGSRYCSANCPYKVRYFNWYNYPEQEHAWPSPMEQQLNPDLTVRTKGVMEKCTFCKQRTYTARSVARTEGRDVRDSDVQTACQESCPTGAIHFGNLHNSTSNVARMWTAQGVSVKDEIQKKDREAEERAAEGKPPQPMLRGYRIFEELRPYPSVMYLERVREDKLV